MLYYVSFPMPIQGHHRRADLVQLLVAETGNLASQDFGACN